VVKDVGENKSNAPSMKSQIRNEALKIGAEALGNQLVIFIMVITNIFIIDQVIEKLCLNIVATSSTFIEKNNLFLRNTINESSTDMIFNPKEKSITTFFAFSVAFENTLQISDKGEKHKSLDTRNDFDILHGKDPPA
jgi:hypothetical protein